MREEQQNRNQDKKPDIIDVIFICWGIISILLLAEVTWMKLPGKAGFLVSEFALLAFAWIYMRSRKLPRIKMFRWRSVPRKSIVYFLLVACAAAILFDELDRLIAIIIPMPEKQLEALKETFAPNTISEIILVIFSVVIVAPIVEESLFRGFVQQTFERRWDVTTAVLVASLVFAVIHLQPWWMIQQLILAVFLGYLSWLWNSILPAVLIHAANNAWALRHITGLDNTTLQFYLIDGHVNPLLIVISVGILWFGLKKTEKFLNNNINQYREPEQ